MDLLPDGLFTTAEKGTEKPKTVTINPRWKITKNTPLPFTVQTVETSVERDLGWELSEFDVDEVIAPAGDVKNYFAFFVPTQLTETETVEFISSGIELSIAINVVYRQSSGKEGRQSFGDFYVCRGGKLEVNKPIGKGPQRSRLEEYTEPSTIVPLDVRVLEDEEKSPPEPD